MILCSKSLLATRTLLSHRLTYGVRSSINRGYDPSRMALKRVVLGVDTPSIHRVTNAPLLMMPWRTRAITPGVKECQSLEQVDTSHRCVISRAYSLHS